jgi:hypothetical protein
VDDALARLFSTRAERGAPRVVTHCRMTHDDPVVNVCSNDFSFSCEL